MNNYDFPVELQPIYLSNGQEIKNRKAVVRTDSMRTLGVVSNDYGLIKHASVIDSFREAGKEFNVTEKISLANDGAKLFYQMTFPKVEAEVKKGDLVRMMMIAKNSYNGGNSLSIVFGAFRLVCENGMIIGTQFLQFAYRHIGNVGGMKDSFVIDQYRDAYKGYIRMFSEKMPYISRMASKPGHAVNDMSFSPKTVKMPKYLLDEAKTQWGNESDHTVWGYYNSLTYAISHKMRKESPARAIVYGMEAWRQAEHLMNITV